MTQIFGNFADLTVQMVIMWAIGAIMIYLAIKKEMEPTLLLPMGFGCILCNMPNSGMVHTLEILFPNNDYRFVGLTAIAVCVILTAVYLVFKKRRGF